LGNKTRIERFHSRQCCLTTVGMALCADMHEQKQQNVPVLMRKNGSLAF